MSNRRVFIFGAGFSKPAGMPLAHELLEPLSVMVENDEMRDWLLQMQEISSWMNHDPDGYRLNIEELLHIAQFDIEKYHLAQHFCPVGRIHGPGTPWSSAESVRAWLQNLEEDLRDVILERDEKADLGPISRWANQVRAGDAVMTFNYDTLVERALADCGKSWNHGFGAEMPADVNVYKLHGSIDWIVAHRIEQLDSLKMLFDKENLNRSEEATGHVEEDLRLWRVPSRESLGKWITKRHLQWVPNGAVPREVGIAGLGAYKPLHRIPGLGYTWAKGMYRLSEADCAIVVGFSMSDFDTFARMQFASVARQRHLDGRPLRVIVVDPCADEAYKKRFQSVFRHVVFNCRAHQDVDWSSLGN